MILSIFGSVEDDKPTRIRDAYVMRLEEIAKNSGPDWGTVAKGLSEDECTERETMEPNNRNGSTVKQISLAEAVNDMSWDAKQLPSNGTDAGNAPDEVLPWQQFAEQVAPKFSEALLGAAEAIYRMTTKEWASQEEALRGAADASDRLDCLSRDLQSIRSMVDSLTGSQQAYAAKVTELETSVEEKVFVALEHGLKCLDDGIRERQETEDGKLNSLSEEISRVGARLEAHADAIRTLAEGMQSQIEHREGFKTGLERLVELAGLPITLGPLPEGL